jgi:methylenetetrahydrofolate--tRNA-(uracil-5-)-methyltransferase
MNISIIGAGFAGVEAAWYLAEQGHTITLYEMRDKVQTEAHHTDLFAELVCSNSFKSMALENAHGLLKEELRRSGSLVIKVAQKHAVAAGAALAVDRDAFSKEITERIKGHNNINVVREEVHDIKHIVSKGEEVIIASGPLTSKPLQKTIQTLTGNESLYFFDAAAPVVMADSIHFGKVFRQSRYDKGSPDYLNAPFSREEYYEFVHELQNAEKVTPHKFESKKLFSGCSPVEDLAMKGDDTLAFGPMKPVGLTDPATGKRPFAVIQMRMENSSGTMYNLVGFQTRMKWNEQKRIFRMIPGLENAEFARLGVIHRNTFINHPFVTDRESGALKNNNSIRFAGQITGVEGYMESAASGLISAWKLQANISSSLLSLPENTMLGSLERYIHTKNEQYQPMASNFGLLNIIPMNKKGKRLRGREKKQAMAETALSNLDRFLHESPLV